MKNIILYTTLFLSISILGIAQESMSFSADNYFNQGNAAYNKEQFGEAVYLYEKALLLDPHSSDIKVNLNLAVERLDTDIIELEPFFLAEWWRGISNLFLPGTWKILSVVFLILLLGLVFMHLFRSFLSRKSAYSLSGVLAVLMLVFILAGSTRTTSIFESKYAILNAEVESLHEGPDSVSEKVKPVVAGVKVKILDSNGEWYKVATMDSEQGWVLKSQVSLLKFEE